MPTRRLVVALTVLLLGVLGVGTVTALSRLGGDGKPGVTGDPLAGRTPGTVTVPYSTPPSTTTPPLTTVDPLPPTSPPATTTPSPGADGTDGDGSTDGAGDPGTDGSDGSGDGSGAEDPDAPHMPETGLPAPFAALALGAAATATLARRLAR